MDFEVDGDPQGRWEFECCGGNNVEFSRAGGLVAEIYEGECLLCGTRYQVTKFKRGRRDRSPFEGRPDPEPAPALAVTPVRG